MESLLGSLQFELAEKFARRALELAPEREDVLLSEFSNLG